MVEPQSAWKRLLQYEFRSPWHYIIALILNVLFLIAIVCLANDYDSAFSAYPVLLLFNTILFLVATGVIFLLRWITIVRFGFSFIVLLVGIILPSFLFAVSKDKGISFPPLPGLLVSFLSLWWFPWKTEINSSLSPKPKVRSPKRSDREWLKKQSGLTLIEVLIVIAIMSLFCAGAFSMLGHFRVSGDSMEDLGRASTLAASEMEALIAAGPLPKDVSETLPLPVSLADLDRLPNATGECQIDPGPTNDLVSATVVIQWENRQGQRHFELTRLLERQTK